MFFRRLFQPPPVTGAPSGRAPAGPTAGAGLPSETAAVRQIVARLEAMPAEQARFIACASYVFARAANADMEITDQETAYMERALQEFAGLDEAQAVLVVEMAKLEERAVGGTEDYLVTREFREMSTPEQRLRILRTCIAVAAVDDTITSAESATVNEIANELEVPAEDLAALRSEYADKFAALRAIRRAGGGGA